MESATDRQRTGAGPEEPKPSYRDYRKARKTERKAERARRKAAKPRGIDLPFRRSMPKPLLIFFGVVAMATLAVVVAVLVSPPAPRIAPAERRSPPGAGVSHDVGEIVLAPVPDPLPATGTPCRATDGVVIEGGEPAIERIGGVLQRLCPHVAGDGDFARSVRALSAARIRFARFARTGDTSTLSVADPVRVLINVGFARRDVSALSIAPLLAHEGFHLLHAAEPWTAELEFDARVVELEACRLMIDVNAWPRGCTDAQQLIDFGRSRAVDQLVAAGFPRGEA